MRAKLHVRDLDVAGRRVLTRVDFNVPLNQDGSVGDETRIERALPTIRYIIDNGGSAVLASHLGRPKGAVVRSMSLRPVADRLSELLGQDVVMAPDSVGDTTEGLVARMADGDVLMLENLRFHKGETENEADFSRRLARMGDVYIDDAFGTAHRAHASTVGVTQYFEKRAMGFLIENELANLSKATDNPRKPYVAILGGAKVSDKIGVIENLMPKVDALLIGGGMAFTFLAARGKGVGASLLEKDKVQKAEELLESAEELGKALVLPVDVVVADEVKEGACSRVVDVDSIEPGLHGVDIGPQTVDEFIRKLAPAQTIVWNGPLGVFEIPAFASGTTAVAKAVARRTDQGATSIIGGGDSAAAVVAAGLEEHVTHVSTGGGASLMFLEGKPLPAIEALTDA
ncbi:MAG: phosphoglycerate kinase [Candidatus Eisenbacteria bacterium]|nr:phosphoglycerate kinase [Candidatus Eisenbacteria bacterium]